MLRIAALLLGFSLTAQAASLRCVGAAFPFVFEGSDAQPSGVAVDLLAALQARLGFNCRYEIMPWKRAQFLIESGQADLLIGPYRTQDRIGKMLFVGLPFYMDAMRFYRRTGGLAWRGDWRALQGQPIGVTRGWTLGQRYEANKAALTLDEGDTLEQGFRKLMSDRVALVASNERNARVEIQHLGLEGQVEPSGPPLQQSGGYFALAPRYAGQPLARALDKALTDLVKSGQVKAVSEQHGLAFPDARFDWPSYLSHELDR